MAEEGVPVDVYCYYRIDVSMESEYRNLARRFQEKYLFRPECLLYQFRRSLDPRRPDTVMECGTFRDRASYEFARADVERRYPELLQRLDQIIVGGLEARKFEFFQAL